MSVAPPDPRRFGGYEWTMRTSGRMSSLERRSAFVAIARGQVANLLGRAKLAGGVIPRRALAVDLDEVVAPDSRLAVLAEEACREQPLALLNHSYRTWLFGNLLAQFDGITLDPELFYCASLLHDYGLIAPILGRDFTLAGAERAMTCARDEGVDEGRTAALADAICAHATPGVTVERDGALGTYLQWGAMADVAGLRIWDIARHNVTGVLSRYPRGTFNEDITRMIRAESEALPDGRFSLLVRSGVLFAVKFAPFER